MNTKIRPLREMLAEIADPRNSSGGRGREDITRRTRAAQLKESRQALQDVNQLSVDKGLL